MKRIMALNWGIAVLVIAIALAGCKLVPMADSYTFRFRVKNSSADTITKIQFFNGTNRSSRMLREFREDLITNEMSDEYSVSGFNTEYGTDERYCGVMVTYDGTDVFNYWHAGPDESKILVTLEDIYHSNQNKITFSIGW